MFYSGLKITAFASLAVAAMFVIHHLRCSDQRSFFSRNRRNKPNETHLAPQD